MTPHDLDGILTAVPAFRLYDLAAVRAALGMRSEDRDDDGYEGDPAEREPASPDTEQAQRIRAILARGEEGCWRRLAHPTLDAIEAVAALGTLAPHMREANDLATRHLTARYMMNMPIKLPALLLCGPPGVGKSWYAGRLCAALGVPFRSYAMSASTLSEGLTGNHGSWRNAGPGLIARTLLQEPLGNPLVFIDEFDKSSAHGWNSDPYRPFYQLLEPEVARTFVDEFLGFGLDTSYVSYVMTANATDGIPAPIMDRLTVIEIAEPDEVQQAAVAASIYREANAALGNFFAAEPSRDLLAALALGHPRGARRALTEAMMHTAAEGRRVVQPSDIRFPVGRRGRRIGF